MSTSHGGRLKPGHLAQLRKFPRDLAKVRTSPLLSTGRADLHDQCQTVDMRSVDGVGEGSQDLDEPGKAAELAKELGRLRWRGLAYVDNRRQGRLVVPGLEALARRHTADDRLSRVELLRRLLQDGLQAFEESGHKEDAEFARRLFFGDRHSTALSRELAGTWLDAARKDSKLQQDKFDDLRRAIFVTFADFLLGFVPPVAEERTGPDTDVEMTGIPVDNHGSSNSPPLTTAPLDQDTTKPPRKRRPTPLFAGAGAAAILIASVWIVLHRNSGESASAHTPSPNHSRSTPSSFTGRPVLTFNDLGGGSSIINVYPGVKDTPEDKLPNGTYQSGNSVGAICKTNGRKVTSDTAAGEHPKESSTWVQIAGTPGLTQYAPLTYAEMTQTQLRNLPSCQEVS